MKNMGKLDQIIRFMVGIGLIAGGLYFETFFGLIGVIPILTAVSGRCPAYMPFGIKTCIKEETAEQTK